jgi:SAM-dependent methyltransferase
VIGIDFAEPLIAAARRLAVEAGYEVDFRVGDAEALAFDDASFDVVVSSFGVIFAGDHERAAAEIKRVCKPGGRLVMTAWDADGVVGRLTREVWAKHGPKPTGNPPRSMLAWGNLEYARSLLGDAFELCGERAASVLSVPSGEAVWDLWARSNGTMIDLLSRKSPEQRQDFRADFIAFHERFRQGEGIVMPREYLLFVGRRNVPREARPGTPLRAEG